MAAPEALVLLKQSNFRTYCISLLASGVSNTMLPAIIALQIYDLTDKAFYLGVVGVVRFAPALVMALLAGAVVDSFDRRLVSQMAQAGTALCVAVLLAVNVATGLTVGVIFAMVFVLAISNSFDFPARGALLPSLVPPDDFQNAITLSGSIRQIGFVTGPVTAGFIVAGLGYSAAYSTVVVIIVISIAVMSLLKPRPIDAPKRAVSVAAIKEGLTFVRRQHIILGCMTLDMFAVIFGGAVALLPVYAKDILGVGKVGYGFLQASLEVGALLMAAILVLVPPVRRPGIVLMWAVLAFGLFTIAFGLSRWYPASLLFYAMIGMADQVSVVMRNTTIQLNTPDNLRGRVSSVNSLFIGASNQLGSAESGFVAAATNATFAVVSGGVGCIAVVGAVFAGIPEMRRYRIRPAVEETDEPSQGAAAG